jgi:hypothetical protein
MPKIQIDIIDTMGNVTALPLPNDKPMDALVESIVTLSDLIETDSYGRRFNYRLFSRRQGRVLSMEGTLYSNGVMDGDQLRISPTPFDSFLELQMLTEPEKGTILSIQTRPRLTIGRGSDNDIVVRDPIVSRQHGELLWQDGLHIYRDLNSANGSYINNQAVTEPMPLTINSMLSLGEGIRLLYRETNPEMVKSQHGELKFQTTDSQTRTSLNPLPRAGLFMSYIPAQQAFVEPIVSELRKANFHVFWEAEMPPGSNAEEAIDSNLKYSDVLVAFLTPDSVTTSTLSDQWNRFIAQRKPIVLIQYDDCEIPHSLGEYPVVPFRGSNTRLTQELIACIIEVIR